MIVVPAGIDWDDPAGYAAILTRGRSGLAWELLRRDPAYRQAVAELDNGGAAVVDSAFVARWGLHFR